MSPSSRPTPVLPGGSNHRHGSRSLHRIAALASGSPSRAPSVGALLLIAALCASVFASAPASANWSSTGNIVANAAGDEQTGFSFTAAGSAVAPDAAGGCFVAYEFSTGNDSIRINRLDGDTGARLWGTNGVKVNQGGHAASAPFVVADLQGGCWVAWVDTRGGSNAIYAQRFDATGKPGGPDGGFLVASTVITKQPTGPAIAASPGGDLLIAYWRTGGAFFVTRIHMQFDGAAPVIEMAESQMTSDTGSPSDAPIQIFADGTGGGVLVWASNRASLPGGAGTVKIVANRFNSAGTRQWGTEGSVVQAGTGVSATLHRALWDGSNLIVCWRHNAATSGIHAQLMDGAGGPKWGSNTTGVTVMSEVTTGFEDYASTNQQPQIAPYEGGVWAAWVDGRNWHQPASNGFQHAQDLYVQRVTAAGAIALAANGSPVDSLPGSVAELKIAPGASSELLLAYRSFLYEAGTLGDIFLTRATTAGVFSSNAILNKTGNPATSDDLQSNPVVAPDGFGGVFVAWDDNRANPNLDVYATHRTGTLALTGPTLTLTFPNGGESLRGLEPVNITWSSTLSPAATVKLEYKFSSSRTLITASTPNDGSFSWAPPNGSSSAYSVVVSEATDGVPRDSSNATFSLCATMDIPGSYGPTVAPNDAVLADLNRDGILDLIVAGSPGVYVERGLGLGGVGDGSFDVPVTSALASSAGDVAVADFNGDGFLDVAASVSSGVTMLTGNGTGALAVGGTFATGSNVRGVVTADFDEDGILDLVAVNGASNAVSILIGHGVNGVGDGTFAAAVSYAVGTNPSRVVVQDLNGDGIFDLAVSNNSSASVSVLLGNGAGGKGNGTFGAATSVATGASPIGLCSGDFNEDHAVDLAVSSSTGVSVLLGNGSGTFAAAVGYSIGSSTRDVVAGDFNDDGRQDLMCAAGVLNDVFILYGNGTSTTGNGTFKVGGFEGGGGQPTQLALGDIREDNVLDGVIVNGTSNDVYPFWGECPNTLPSTITVHTPNGGNFFQVGSNQTITWARGAGIQTVNVEVSRDAGVHWQTIATDLADTSFTWTVTAPQAVGSARVRVRDSELQNRNDQSDQSFTISSNPMLVMAPNGGESFRGFDFVVARWGSVPGIPNVKLQYQIDGVLSTILASTPNDGLEVINLPNVTTSQGKLIVSDAADGNPTDSSDLFFSICKRMSDPVPSTALSRPSGITTGDFNSDGIVDLAFAPFGSDSLGVTLGQGSGGIGNGSFAPATYTATAAIGQELATGDFNSDGITDVIATTPAAGVLMFVGQGSSGVGNGAFAPGTLLSTGAGSGGVAVADFNEDGIDDIAVTTPTLNRVDVLIGLGANGVGNGTFAAAAHMATQNTPLRIAIADFNHDGIWDLAASNNGSASISVLIGNGVAGKGDGTFAAGVNYPAPPAPHRIIARDFGDDAVVDLAVMGGSEIWTLPGNGSFAAGDGTFGSHELSTVLGGAADMAIMDVNFDEFADLAVAATSPSRVDLMTNDSGGAFGPIGSIPLASTALLGIAVGDFNEDGAHDFATSMALEGKIATSLGSLCGATPGAVTLTGPGPQPGPGAVSATARDARRARAASAASTAASWAVGSTQAISWTKSLNVLAVDLAISRDGGATWHTIARAVPGTSFAWTVTAPASATVKLRASDSASPGVVDVSLTPITITDSSVGVAPSGLPSVASFSNGHPNPAHGEVSFEMALPKESDVQIEVFDLSGRRLETLAHGRWNAGYHQVRWSGAASGTSGVYFVRSRWQGYDMTRRIVRMP